MYFKNPIMKKIKIWKNPRPSLTKYCIPVRFLFEKETRYYSK